MNNSRDFAATVDIRGTKFIFEKRTQNRRKCRKKTCGVAFEDEKTLQEKRDHLTARSLGAALIGARGIKNTRKKKSNKRKYPPVYYVYVKKRETCLFRMLRRGREVSSRTKKCARYILDSENHMWVSTICNHHFRRNTNTTRKWFVFSYWNVITNAALLYKIFSISVGATCDRKRQKNWGDGSFLVSFLLSSRRRIFLFSRTHKSLGQINPRQPNYTEIWDAASLFRYARYRVTRKSDFLFSFISNRNPPLNKDELFEFALASETNGVRNFPKLSNKSAAKTMRTFECAMFKTKYLIFSTFNYGFQTARNYDYHNGRFRILFGVV